GMNAFTHRRANRSLLGALHDLTRLPCEDEKLHAIQCNTHREHTNLFKIFYYTYIMCYHVETIELVNDGTGLGFGIVGGKTTGVIVKTILPGGIADQNDGRLLPGDRLMYVNATNLENASLEDAVQALKGAKLGTVQMGVAKPLPVSITVLSLHWLVSFWEKSRTPEKGEQISLYL
uniref:PDZ domain-containing protein n=1 Tax=Amphiprion percula TaxID=161767 RepID=A0A3P8U5U0_AMPPE